ncbi:MAG: helix-turn-helix domain-containing protein [Oscillospiraceae bacterium]|jgi:transcriptional regulator with XRE-family HTH domain|nr:helix-turn-helix domain-containing protein [Oscillospiraceae bacterium]
MTIYLSETLRAMRRERDLTQEELADILCVSPQAVSRWETGATYPDIALLPALAEFYEITVDELLGSGKAKRQAKLAEYASRFDDALNKGDVYGAIDLSRAAVKDFPNDYKMLNNLMYVLFLSGDETGNIADWRENIEKYKAEIDALGERILRHCTDDLLRNEVKLRLAFHYIETGRKPQALELLKTVPSDKDATREYIEYYALEGEERLALIRRILLSGLGKMQWGIHAYVKRNENASSEDKAKWLNLILQVYELIFDRGDYGFYLADFAIDNIHFAEYRLEAGDENAAFGALEVAAGFAVQYARLSESCVFESELVRGIPAFTNMHTADTRGFCAIVLEEHLSKPCFDVIRGTEKFRNIIAILGE